MVIAGVDPGLQRTGYAVLRATGADITAILDAGVITSDADRPVPERLGQIAEGIDEYAIRQPVGVAAIICPFNFPGMIPFWFLPYAVACGNTVIVKPSERCPRTMMLLAELILQAGFPAGVVRLPVQKGQ